MIFVGAFARVEFASGYVETSWACAEAKVGARRRVVKASAIAAAHRETFTPEIFSTSNSKQELVLLIRPDLSHRRGEVEPNSPQRP